MKAACRLPVEQLPHPSSGTLLGRRAFGRMVSRRD